jgi:hypothetical protein
MNGLLFNRVSCVNPKPKTSVHPHGYSQIDVSLINFSLALSPEARIEAHENARRLLEDLREAGQNYYANRSKSLTDKTAGT